MNGLILGVLVSLSSDGYTIAVGDPQKSSIDVLNIGAVHVYRWNGDSWIQLGQEIIGTHNQEHVGLSVSLSANGNIVAFGAKDNSSNNNGGFAMNIYVEWFFMVTNR